MHNFVLLVHNYTLFDKKRKSPIYGKVKLMVLYALHIINTIRRKA